ncbi:MAG: metallophosphoesterase family protein [Candidatus Aenigmatarchaeota archaeon]
MRISIISDMHLGYGTGTERENDCFEAAEESIDASEGCDAILVAGDIFDTKNPSTETLVRAMQLFMKTMFWKGGARVYEGIGKDLSVHSPLNYTGVPVIAIHGTHERRPKGLMNPVEGLEKAGFVIYLHANGVVLEKNGEKVCVQGLSGVPDQYAESIIKEWDPKPVEGCFNIFMLHQSISPFLCSENFIEKENLPEGFDLYVFGHIHEPQQSEHSEAPVLIPGSTIQTQLNKESVQSRGFWVVDTKTRDIEFRELESQRKVYYRAFESPKTEDVENEIERILEEQHNKKPIIRIKLTGKEIDTSPLEEKFKDRAILSFKKEFEDEQIEAKSLEEQRVSVQEMGRKILQQNLSAAGLDPQKFESIFELMLEKRVEEARDLLYKNER